MIELFDDLGRRGWELVGFCNGTAYFKRPTGEEKPEVIVINPGMTARQVEELVVSKIQKEAEALRGKEGA